MRTGPAVALSLLLGLVPPTLARAEPALGEEEAASAARRFGRALTDADPSALKPLLPRQGKVRVRLDCLGPAQGSLSAAQLTAMIQDFLRRGAVRSFEVVRTEVEADRFALVQGLASVLDREGRRHALRLDLTFQPEGGSWILREMRESPP
jgi:hypothetical protein